MKTLAILMTLVVLSACGKKDIDKIAEAQECLDKATENTALACLQKVEGVESKAADILRCSAYFIDQGFSDPVRMEQVATQITSTQTPDNASLSALSVLGFTSQKYTMTENFNLSETAFPACVRSGSGGLVYLAAATRMATAALTDMGFDSTTGTPPDINDMENAICNGTPSSTTKEAMGNAALAAYQQNCLGKDISTDVMCQQYQAAIAAHSDPTDIGTELIDVLCN